MRHFTVWEVEAAQDHADAGGQSLHTHRIIVDWEQAPECFRREVEAGRDIAHLFDRSELRLRETAGRLGVRVVVVENPGRRGQHIDLCGGPLRRALAESRRESSREASLFE